MTLLDTALASLPTTECVPWPGCLSASGYGHATSERRSYKAHRLVYERAVGPIPDGLELDHLCRNRACVNPAHLEPVTRKTNQRRGYGPSGINARKTHCPQDHEYTEANTYLYQGMRLCRACLAANNARQTERRRALRRNESS